MKFVKGVLIGSAIAAGAIMMYNDRNDGQKKADEKRKTDS